MGTIPPGWFATTPRYSAKDDSIELVDEAGKVCARLYRNMVIRMVGMLPPDPPPLKRKKGKK